MNNQVSSVGTPGSAVVMQVTYCIYIAMYNPTCKGTYNAHARTHTINSRLSKIKTVRTFEICIILRVLKANLWFTELQAQRLQQSSHVILLMACWSLVVPFKNSNYFKYFSNMLFFSML